jgi:kynureninase
VPVDVHALNVDAAVGGLLKWGCGGPGNCFLYVRPDMIPKLVPRMVGWFSHKRPFDFDMSGLDMRDDIWRYAGGTPNVPAVYAGLTGAEIINEVGVENIRKRHIEFTTFAIERAQEEGLKINSPLDSKVRGGHVTVEFPGSKEACDELIRRKFIVDFRPGSGIRIAPHFYNEREEVDAVFAELRKIIDRR